MPHFIKAKYDSKLKVAQFITDDNRVLIRSGGSLPWRIFNCGDLLSPMKDGKPAPKLTKNIIGFANPEGTDRHFFIFPDYETGRAELKASLRRRQHIWRTIKEMVYAFAPPSDGNNTEKYLKDLCKETGFDKDFRLKDMDEKQLTCLMDGIEKLEGYHNHKDTRKEIWAPITQIQAGNGAQPVEGEELVVRNEGKETTYKSNAAGLFPPIAHGKAPAEVFHKTPDGTLKKLADLQPEKGQRFTLKNKTAEYVGETAPVKAPENPIAKKEGFLYEVRENDTLGHIAVLFKDCKVTVQRLKQDNQLKTDTIYAGQILGINMPHPSGTPPKATKKAPPTPPSIAKNTTNGMATTPAPPKASNPMTAQQTMDKMAQAPAPNASPPLVAASISKSNETKAGKTTNGTDSAPPKSIPPPANTTSARSKDGKGEPLALIAPEGGKVPWMKFALAEAKKHNGADEAVIEKSINYQTAIKDGMKTMIGDNNPWCAAFANWCVMQAGYPIQNPKSEGYIDIADLSRANGFRYVNVKDKIQPEPEIDKITGKKKRMEIKKHLEVNPLYFKIDEPIYGAIAVVVSPHGHGHHVGFAYGRNKYNDEEVCILGGNQGGKISFLPYAEKERFVKERNKSGKLITKKDDHLEFYLPRIYEQEYKKGNEKLGIVDWVALNKEIGIEVKKKSDRSIL